MTSPSGEVQLAAPRRPSRPAGEPHQTVAAGAPARFALFPFHFNPRPNSRPPPSPSRHLLSPHNCAALRGSPHDCNDGDVTVGDSAARCSSLTPAPRRWTSPNRKDKVKDWWSGSISTARCKLPLPSFGKLYRALRPGDEGGDDMQVGAADRGDWERKLLLMQRVILREEEAVVRGRRSSRSIAYLHFQRCSPLQPGRSGSSVTIKFSGMKDHPLLAGSGGATLILSRRARTS